MTNRWKKLAICLISALLLTPVVAQDQEQALADLMAELESLGSTLKEFQQERDRVETDLSDQEIILSNIHKQIHDTNSNLVQGERNLVELQSRAKGLEANKKRQEVRLRDDIQAMHQTGSEEPLKMLLNQNSPSEFSRMLNYYQYLLEARAESIESFFDTLESLEQTRIGITQQQTKLERLSEDLSAQEVDLASARKVRLNLLEQLNSRILTAEEQIEEKEKDRERLEQLISEVEERIGSLAPPDSYKPFAELKGQYVWPVNGEFAHRYNSTKNGSLRWQGVVIGSAAGSSVTTIHHGRIVFADYLRGYGLLVIVDHGDDYLSLYGHNQSLFVEPGDWVAPGDQIALVGNSGGISEYGLYFEIRHQGQPDNPTNWAKR